MDALINKMKEELFSFIQSHDFGAEVLDTLLPVDIWTDALRVLFFLDCIDEAMSKEVDPKVLVLTENMAQMQVFSEWLVMSNRVHPYLGKIYPGARGVTHTSAGKVRIMLRSDFNEAWVNPVALVPFQTSFDEKGDLALYDPWATALFKAKGGLVA
jgi:hypothetical protein